MAKTPPILIVGAGTTGLAMACELARHCAPVRIIDKQSGINPHCRACSVHARTLEIFHDFGIVDEIPRPGSQGAGHLRGPKHTLLLFPGADHEAKSWRRLAELARSVESDLDDLINVYFVAIEAGSVPSNPKFHGRLILDPERSLHYRYGAETECMYLIRPDGYVGYRSEPATTSAFHANTRDRLKRRR